jgi:hypothetical protein
MLNTLKNNEEFARDLIKADFYVKNILGNYYDSEETPII